MSKIKFLGAVALLLNGLFISLIAGGVSVYGMILIFGGHAMIIGIMIGSIELGKLSAAIWLKLNWKNKSVPLLHKSYLVVCVALIMGLTSIGVYGFMSAAHLDQNAPVAGIEIQTKTLEVQLDQKNNQIKRLESRLTQIDQNIAVYLNNNQASRGLSASKTLNKERDTIQTSINTTNEEINALNIKLTPLKVQSSQVEAKLGPVKYLASAMGWDDPEVAVRLVILVIMIAFDPLAVVLVISAMISFKQWADDRKIIPVVETVAEPTIEPIEDTVTETTIEPIVEETVTEPVIEPVPEFIDTRPVRDDILVPPKTEREVILDLMEHYPEIVTDLLEAAKDLNEKGNKPWLNV